MFAVCLSFSFSSLFWGVFYRSCTNTFFVVVIMTTHLGIEFFLDHIFRVVLTRALSQTKGNSLLNIGTLNDSEKEYVCECVCV